MPAVLDRFYHLHWVTPEIARSAQPYLGFYRAFLRPHRFQSLINLRGENAGARWWRKEKRVAADLGIIHFDVRLSSRNLPSRANLAALMDAFDAAKLPVLIKCSGGQDRTSLASALLLLHLRGVSALPQAQAQFALWPYLHRPKRNQKWLRRFPAYAVEQVGASDLASWVRKDYAPGHFAAWLTAQGFPHSYAAVQAAEFPTVELRG